LAVHPHDPKLLQVQDAVQRDQEARRRQARRGDLDELRRLQQEIAKAADAAAKQALVERIQAIAAKHWTDGEILSIANALLLRLGLVPQESSAGSARRKGATVIFHVPRPNAPEAARVPASQIASSTVATSPTPPSPVPPSVDAPVTIATHTVAPSVVSPTPVAPNIVTESAVEPSKRPPSKIAGRKVPSRTVPRAKVAATPSEPLRPAPQAAIVPAAENGAPLAPVTPRSSLLKQPARSNATILIVVSAAVIALVASVFFFARKRQAPAMAQAPEATPTVSAPAVAPPTPTPEPTSEPTPVLPSSSSDTNARKVTPQDQPPTESSRGNLGTLVIMAGQDGARVSLNGKLQRQLTQGGQLRLRNLEPKDYVVQVSKKGFLDPPQQTVRIRNGGQVSVTFNLQPQPPRMASLAIQGGAPGTAVFVDQAAVGTIQPDGTLTVSTVNPGDHTVELRKDRFKSRQFKKRFVAGTVISLAAADATLEAAAGQLKITFAPADANVAVVRGDFLKMVSSGVPLSLAPGTYTLTARTADRFTRSATLEVVAGQSKTLDLSLVANGMSKWEDPGAWKHEGDSFSRKGGDFVLYGAVPASGTFVFSAMLTKGHLLQWVIDYTDPKNYVLFQMDDNYFYRTVIRNGQKASEIRISDKSDKKNFHALHIGVSATEIVHQIKHGDSWTVVDRWTQPGANLGRGKFGFYIPGSDQVELSGFAHYADLNIR
jgi:hypothetical protein